MKCYLCNKINLTKKKVARTLYGGVIGNFNAEVCTKCNEVFYDEKTSREITKKTQEMGLWGLESKTRVGVSGSVLDIRLSKKISSFFNLKKGEEVRIYPEDEKHLVVEVS